jgi:hypothetical protein
MAENSLFWTTGGAGDGATPYDQEKIFAFWRQMFIGDDEATQGVVPRVGNRLEVTSGAGVVNVANGRAIVYGIPYKNTSVVAVPIPVPASNTRIDRIVLRANWAAQTVRVTRIVGTEGAGAPSLTQSYNSGTPSLSVWDLPLAQVSITTGGAITVTDQRAYCHYRLRAAAANFDDQSITAPKLEGGGITAAMIGDDQVTTNKFANDSVTNAKIAANANIPYTKIASVPPHLHNGVAGDGAVLTRFNRVINSGSGSAGFSGGESDVIVVSIVCPSAGRVVAFADLYAESGNGRAWVQIRTSSNVQISGEIVGEGGSSSGCLCGSVAVGGASTITLKVRGGVGGGQGGSAGGSLYLIFISSTTT